MKSPLLTTVYLDGKVDFGCLFSVPESCLKSQDDKKCTSFQEKVSEDGLPFAFQRCPYGFASCRVAIDGKVAIVCGLNVKKVSPRKKAVPKCCYLPAISEKTAVDLAKKNVSYIERSKEADRQRKYIPTLVHGLSKILDRARTKGEYLLKSADDIQDRRLKESLTSVAVSTLAATVVFYAHRVQVQNASIGHPHPIDIYGKFFKMRKLLENCGGTYRRIDFCGEPKYLYHLYLSFEVAVFQLLENANKYTPEGNTISVHFDEVDEGLLIEIENFGPHIPKKELKRIKEFGCRGKNAQGYTEDGSGIGLASVSNIAEVNGISFDVDSRQYTIDIGGVPFSEFVATLKIPISLRGDERTRMNRNE